jgi:uncharacterized protein
VRVPPQELLAGLLLAAVGFLGGVITAIVGGSSLICFPAMLAAGLPPVVASASNTVAVTPASLVATFSDPERKPVSDRRTIVLALIALVGSAVGAMLLIKLPETTFVRLLPALIGVATLMFVAGPRSRVWIDHRIASGRRDPSGFLQLLLFAPVSVYGGYFGAGLGVMALAVLGLHGSDDYRTANVLKNLLCTLTSVVAIGLYIIFDVVNWPATLAMMSGAICGGFAGGRLMPVLPARLFRLIVTTVGAILTILYAQRYWTG